MNNIKRIIATILVIVLVIVIGLVLSEISVISGFDTTI